MRLLAIETSEYVSSVALWEGGRVINEAIFPSRMELCETLTARIAELLGVECVAAARLDALAVSQGPGSFTGLRVGMATAKALAHVLDVPLVGVPTQQAIATAADVPFGTVVCVLQKARQGHVYAGLWERTVEGAREVEPLAVVADSNLASFVADRCSYLTGPATETTAGLLHVLSSDLNIQHALPTAAAVARLGAPLVAQAAPRAAFNLQPLYILASQAERQKQIDVTTGGGLAASRVPVRVRRTEMDDLPQIMKIENASFSSPWSELAIREEIARRDDSLFIVVEYDGEIAGYSGCWIFAGEAHICTIATNPAYRRRGLGELLMLVMLQRSSELEVDYAILEYRVSNRSAEALYHKLGFQYIHRRRGYYQDNNEDAVVAAIPELRSEAQQQKLDELYQIWRNRYSYDLSVDI